MSAPLDRLRDPQQRAQRAARILDAAAELLLRHGYRRVTVEDVAAGAGIGKGTVYLHYHSREELFAAVVGRETLHAFDELLRALRADAQTGLLHRFARTYFLAILHRPLLRGFVLADAELWGKLTPRGSGRDQQHHLLARAYFELLARHGLLRQDMDLDAIASSFQATFEGFLRAEAAHTEATAPGTTDRAAPGVEQRADLLAQTVQRAFESGRTLPQPALQSLTEAVIDLLTSLITTDRADLGLPEP